MLTNNLSPPPIGDLVKALADLPAPDAVEVRDIGDLPERVGI